MVQLSHPYMTAGKTIALTAAAAAVAQSLQSCPTLCDPIDGSPPGSPVPGILQAGTLEWVAISFSNAWKWKVKVKSESEVAQSCLTLSDSMVCSSSGSSVHGIFPGKSTGVGCHCLLLLALTTQTFVGKVMSLLFNMLSRLVIALLSRSKHFLILWLQPPSTVILEPKKIKPLTVSIVSSSNCHEVMGGEGYDRGWDGWMASLTQWTWVWVNSGTRWWTGRPGVLWFMGSRRVAHDWMTDLTDWLNGTRCHDLSFLNFAFSSIFFSPSSSTFIKRLFSSFLLSSIRVVSSQYLRLLIFLPAILFPAYTSSSPAVLMMYSIHKLNKQGDNIQPWCIPSPIWNQSVVLFPVLTVASWLAYRFLRRQVRWSATPMS